MATLRDYREEHYISRRELSLLAGVSESTIVRIEDGTGHVTKQVADKVLKALSAKIGQTITLKDVEGFHLYNVMRDRRNRPKGAGTRQSAEQREVEECIA